MKKNLILHLRKAKLAWLPVVVSLLSVSVFSAPIAIAQPAIDEACEVVTVPEFGTTYQVRWSSECPSHRFKGVSRYVKFSVSERSRYRITTDSGSYNFITLYDASGDILKGSAPEVDGLFSFKYSPEVIAVLNPGTYYVGVAIHSEAVPFDRVPFEFSISELVIPDDPFRPIQGGVGLITSREEACTLGFAATIRRPFEEIKGVVTNSHCVNAPGRQGNAQLSQGGELITSTILAESQLLNRNSPDDAFEGFGFWDRLTCSTNCRYSDAAFLELEEGFDVSYSITRLKEINTNTPRWMADNDGSSSPSTLHLEVDSAQPSFEIAGVGRAEVGDTVHKIGRTTGWTTGVVTGVCRDIAAGYGTGESVYLFCQDTFEHPGGSVVSGSGDSGSPVFKCVTAFGRDDPGCQNSHRVILVGIYHSTLDQNVACYKEERGEICYGSGAHFSPMDSILRDLNESFRNENICWVLTSTGDCYSSSTGSPRVVNSVLRSPVQPSEVTSVQPNTEFSQDDDSRWASNLFWIAVIVVAVVLVVRWLRGRGRRRRHSDDEGYEDYEDYTDWDDLEDWDDS